ncbi:MAG TPA: hypothetical protein VM029_17690 [Opitutaceae bacterium]|nr:hypothetical protein [Opitutaceae bacterium]
MDAAVKAQVAGGRFMGSVLVARDGAVVFEKSRVVPALLAFQPLSLYMKFPVSDHGWRPFALRAGAAFGFTLLMALVFWRHYHKNLKPDHARQKEILRDLS